MNQHDGLEEIEKDRIHYLNKNKKVLNNGKSFQMIKIKDLEDIFLLDE